MSTVDQLLIFLAEDSRNVSARMTAAPFSEDQIRGAWNYALTASAVVTSKSERASSLQARKKCNDSSYR